MAVLFPRPTSVYKATGGVRTKGKWVPGTYTLYTVMGRARYFTAFEVSNLPDGKVNTGHIKFFSNDRLNAAVDGDDSIGDIIVYDGKYFEVIQETHTPMGLINHYRYEAEFRPARELNIP